MGSHCLCELVLWSCLSTMMDCVSSRSEPKCPTPQFSGFLSGIVSQGKVGDPQGDTFHEDPLGHFPRWPSTSHSHQQFEFLLPHQQLTLIIVFLLHCGHSGGCGGKATESLILFL